MAERVPLNVPPLNEAEFRTAVDIMNDERADPHVRQMVGGVIARHLSDVKRYASKNPAYRTALSFGKGVIGSLPFVGSTVADSFFPDPEIELQPADRGVAKIPLGSTAQERVFGRAGEETGIALQLAGAAAVAAAAAPAAPVVSGALGGTALGRGMLAGAGSRAGRFMDQAIRQPLLNRPGAVIAAEGFSGAGAGLAVGAAEEAGAGTLGQIGAGVGGAVVPGIAGAAIRGTLGMGAGIVRRVVRSEESLKNEGRILGTRAVKQLLRQNVHSVSQSVENLSGTIREVPRSTPLDTAVMDAQMREVSPEDWATITAKRADIPSGPASKDPGLKRLTMFFTSLPEGSGVRRSMQEAVDGMRRFQELLQRPLFDGDRNRVKWAARTHVEKFRLAMTRARVAAENELSALQPTRPLHEINEEGFELLAGLRADSDAMVQRAYEMVDPQGVLNIEVSDIGKDIVVKASKVPQIQKALMSRDERAFYDQAQDWVDLPGGKDSFQQLQAYRQELNRFLRDSTDRAASNRIREVRQLVDAKLDSLVTSGTLEATTATRLRYANELHELHSHVWAAGRMAGIRAGSAAGHIFQGSLPASATWSRLIHSGRGDVEEARRIKNALSGIIPGETVVREGVETTIQGSKLIPEGDIRLVRDKSMENPRDFTYFVEIGSHRIGKIYKPQGEQEYVASETVTELFGLGDSVSGPAPSLGGNINGAKKLLVDQRSRLNTPETIERGPPEVGYTGPRHKPFVEAEWPHIKDAVVRMAYDYSSDASGRIIPRKLMMFRRNYQGFLSEFPESDALLQNIGRLQKRIDDLDIRTKRYNGLVEDRAIALMIRGLGGPEQAIAEVLKSKNPAVGARRLRRLVSGDVDAQMGLRRAFWSELSRQARSHNLDQLGTPVMKPEFLLDFLSNPQNVMTMKELGFPAAHIARIREIGLIGKAIKESEDLIGSGVDTSAIKNPMKDFSGVTIPALFSRLYGVVRGVVGPRFVISELGARFLNLQVSKASRAQVMETLERALVDPEFARQLLNDFDVADKDVAKIGRHLYLHLHTLGIREYQEELEEQEQRASRIEEARSRRYGTRADSNPGDFRLSPPSSSSASPAQRTPFGPR